MAFFWIILSISCFIILSISVSEASSGRSKSDNHLNDQKVPTNSSSLKSARTYYFDEYNRDGSAANDGGYPAPSVPSDAYGAMVPPYMNYYDDMMKTKPPYGPGLPIGVGGLFGYRNVALKILLIAIGIKVSIIVLIVIGYVWYNQFLYPILDNRPTGTSSAKDVTVKGFDSPSLLALTRSVLTSIEMFSKKFEGKSS